MVHDDFTRDLLTTTTNSNKGTTKNNKKTKRRHQHNNLRNQGHGNNNNKNNNNMVKLLRTLGVRDGMRVEKSAACSAPAQVPGPWALQHAVAEHPWHKRYDYLQGAQSLSYAVTPHWHFSGDELVGLLVNVVGAACAPRLAALADDGRAAAATSTTAAAGQQRHTLDDKRATDGAFSEDGRFIVTIAGQGAPPTTRRLYEVQLPDADDPRPWKPLPGENVWAWMRRVEQLPERQLTRSGYASWQMAVDTELRNRTLQPLHAPNCPNVVVRGLAVDAGTARTSTLEFDGETITLEKFYDKRYGVVELHDVDRQPLLQAAANKDHFYLPQLCRFTDAVRVRRPVLAFITDALVPALQRLVRELEAGGGTAVLQSSLIADADGTRTLGSYLPSLAVQQLRSIFWCPVKAALAPPPPPPLPPPPSGTRNQTTSNTSTSAGMTKQDGREEWFELMRPTQVYDGDEKAVRRLTCAGTKERRQQFVPYVRVQHQLDTSFMNHLGVRRSIDAVSYTHLTLPTIYSV